MFVGAAGSALGQAVPGGAVDPWRPDPREIALPVIETGHAAMPGVKELPARGELPDVMKMNDGSAVTKEKWGKRREEMRETLEYYMTGYVPSAPGNVKGREVAAAEVAGPGGRKVTYRLVELTFGPGERCRLNVGLYVPVTDAKKVPAVVEIGWNTPPGAEVLAKLPNGPTQGRGADVLLVVGGGVAASQSAGTGALGVTAGRKVPMEAAERFAATSPVLAHGCALATFCYTDAGEDTTLRNQDGSWTYRGTRFFPAYPNYDWGLAAAWAWGASRVADYLEMQDGIDQTKLMVTGFSRCGKAALIAGAFDERFALVAPDSSSGAGTPAFRFSGADHGGNEGLTEMVRKYPNWFGPHLHEFWGQPEKLPFDQHWFIAMCAPRAFIALEGLQDRNVNKVAVRKSYEGARGASELMGVPERLGINWIDRPHGMTAGDWEAMMAFAEKTLNGKEAGRTFDQWPDAAK
jgi:hypothetical protein